MSSVVRIAKEVQSRGLATATDYAMVSIPATLILFKEYVRFIIFVTTKMLTQKMGSCAKRTGVDVYDIIRMNSSESV